VISKRGSAEVRWELRSESSGLDSGLDSGSTEKILARLQLETTLKQTRSKAVRTDANFRENGNMSIILTEWGGVSIKIKRVN
jgi:hypothetical protein